MEETFMNYPTNYVPKDSVVVTLWLDTEHMIFFSDRQVGRIGYSFACSFVNGRGRVWPLQTLFRGAANVLLQVTHVFVVPKVAYVCKAAPDNISCVFVAGRVLQGITMGTTQITVTVSREERMSAVPVQFTSTSTGLAAEIGSQLATALTLKSQWLDVSSLVRVPRFSRAKYFYWDTTSSLMSALPTTDHDVPVLCWQQAGAVFPVNRDYQIAGRFMSLSQVEALTTPDGIPEVFQLVFVDKTDTESTLNDFDILQYYDNIQPAVEQHVDELLLASSRKYKLCSGDAQCMMRKTMEMGGDYTA